MRGSANDDYDRRFIYELTRLERSRNPGAEAEPTSRSMSPGQARATLAALRRALGKPVGQAPEAYPFVTPLLPRREGSHYRDQDESDEMIYYMVAALFAFHPRNWPMEESTPWRTNFGASMARLKNESVERSAGTERRFVALLNSPFAELEDHLRHALSLLKSKDISVDWLQLVGDLRKWDFDDRAVQRAWARAFWEENQIQGIRAVTSSMLENCTSWPRNKGR
jgi:CRISPR system Cascade subunit CasB